MSATRRRDLREVIREEPLWHRPILQVLARGAMTVPEIAQAIGQPPDEVLLWVMGMRRYGLVVEIGDPNDEGYYAYRALAGGDNA